MTKYEEALERAGIFEHSEWFGGGYSRMDDSGTRDQRQEFVERFSWAIPNDAVLDAIRKFAPVLEIGSGSGYWASELMARGTDIVATDPEPGGTEVGQLGYKFVKTWTSILRMDAKAAVRMYGRNRSLLMVWPCWRGSWASDAVEAYQGKTVLYVGEGEGGCTGDDRLFELFKRDFKLSDMVHIPTWARCKDCLHVYQRR